VRGGREPDDDRNPRRHEAVGNRREQRGRRGNAAERQRSGQTGLDEPEPSRRHRNGPGEVGNCEGREDHDEAWMATGGE